MGEKEFTIDDLIGPYPPPIRDTVDRLRRIVLEIAPDANQQVNPGWRNISYSHSNVGYYCGIFPFEDRVDLIFEFGALLPDHEGILQGDARQVRFLRFYRLSDICVRPIKRFLRAALALPAQHSVRRGLIRSKRSPDQQP